MRGAEQTRWNTKVIALSVVTVGVAIFLWNTPLLLPIKMFVVLLHEISHGLAALLTGGRIERLVLTANEGGLAFTRGGNRFIILSAGYLGSALWGVLLMRLAWSRPRARTVAIRLLAVAVALVTLLYLRGLYTFLYGVLASLFLLWIAWRGGAGLQMAVLWVLGSFSALYAIIDIGTDILLAGPLAGIPLLGGPARANDAEMLAEITFIPAFLWGLLWSGVALALFLTSLLALARSR